MRGEAFGNEHHRVVLPGLQAFRILIKDDAVLFPVDGITDPVLLDGRIAEDQDTGRILAGLLLLFGIVLAAVDQERLFFPDGVFDQAPAQCHRDGALRRKRKSVRIKKREIKRRQRRLRVSLCRFSFFGICLIGIRLFGICLIGIRPIGICIPGSCFFGICLFGSCFFRICLFGLCFFGTRISGSCFFGKSILSGIHDDAGLRRDPLRELTRDGHLQVFL